MEVGGFQLVTRHLTSQLLADALCCLLHLDNCIKSAEVHLWSTSVMMSVGHTSKSWGPVLVSYVNTFNQNLENDPVSLCQHYVKSMCQSNYSSRVWVIWIVRSGIWCCENIKKPGLQSHSQLEPVQFTYQPHWVVDMTWRSTFIWISKYTR